MIRNNVSASTSPVSSAPSQALNLPTCPQGINVLVPMGGIGSRFAKSGYRYPKPMINIVGRPMLFWLVDNLKLTKDDTLWLALMRVVDEEFQIAAHVQREFKHIKVKTVYLEFETRGAAETLYIVTQSMADEDLAKRTISLDCDTIYMKDILTPVRQLEQNVSACIHFEDSGVKAVFSYIALDEQQRITDIREKVAISKHANTGAYVFSSGHTLQHYAASVLDAGVGVAGEYYTSSIISMMISKGEAFKGVEVGKGDFFCVGTPDQLDEFLQIVVENPGMVKKRRFCFDLDNTLVTIPTVEGDYASCQPKWNNIQLLKQLKAAGHYIIINTARRMRTHTGNIGAVIRDIGMITMQQLADLGIEYDELHFGKPWAHLYIDDLAVSALLDTGKEIGWYAPHEKARASRKQAQVNARSFNSVQTVGEKVVKASAASSIDGEAFFHCNVPDDVANLFPALYAVDYNTDTRQTSITMGRVDGVTFSYLCVGSGLTPGRFGLMLSAIESLHRSNGYSSRPLARQGHTTDEWIAASQKSINKPATKDLTEDLYANYHTKAVSRVRSYESVYANLGINYESALRTLTSYFEGYQAENRALPVKCIHGDPVFSNVLITKDGSIKFIDMRGRLGNTLTTAGDALYDLAKVYQSASGYDYIILDKEPNPRQSNALRQRFWQWLQSDYLVNFPERNLETVKRDIQAAAALLVFTLIPLHDNLEHHTKFVNMFNDMMSEANLVF